MSSSDLRTRLSGLPRALLPLYTGTIVTRMGTFVVPYLTLYLSQERVLSLSTTGRVVAAGGVGLLLGNIVGGWLADRVGRRTCLLVALAINAVGVATLGMGLPTSTSYALALGLALMGAGMYTPAANAWVADLTSKTQRPLAYTVNYICINIGMGLGPLLGGLLAASSFRWLFVGDVVSTLACAGLIASTASTPVTSVDTRGTNARIRLTAKSLPVLAFCGASFFIIAPLMGLEYVVPLYVGTVLREPLVLVGVVYSINAACILVLGIPVERLVARRSPLLMMVSAGLLWTLGLTMLALGSSARALVVSTVVWTLGEMIGSVVVPTFVSRRVPAHVRGRFLAVVDAMRSVSGIAAPIVLGVVWEQRGIASVWQLLVATPLLGTLLYGTAWLGRRR